MGTYISKLVHKQLFEIRSYREYSEECGVRDECEVFVVRSEGVLYEALYMSFLVIVLYIVQDKHSTDTLWCFLSVYMCSPVLT